MRAFVMARLLAVSMVAVLTAPAPVAAQDVGALSGSMAVMGGNQISGSTLQNATTGMGNAAGTALQGLAGKNVNANVNTNQNTTGVNIGGINYTGVGGEGGGAGADASSTFASPSQYIGFGSSTSYSTSLIQIPGFVGVPSNFSQPYKPELWVNGPGPIVPSSLSLAQADECRASGVSSNWDGGERPPADTIELIWPSLGQKFPTMTSPTGYVGTSKVTATEKYSFMATICQGAYEAMRKGVTKGIVTFVIRPRNRSSGIGFGGSSGGSWLTSGVTNTHPYALAGALGFGTGMARAYAEGELMMHIVGLRELKSGTPKTKVAPIASSPAPQVADKPRDDAERAREQATEKVWFGAPASGPLAGVSRPQAGLVNGALVDAAEVMPPPIQQVAEKPQAADAGIPRVPAAERAWFGGGYGTVR